LSAVARAYLAEIAALAYSLKMATRTDDTVGARCRHFKQGLTLRYLVALILIAALTVLASSLFRHILATIDRLAAITAICGSQRLLTQRVLAQCLLLAAADDAEALRDIRAELARAAKALETNHNRLLADWRAPDALVVDAPELRRLYFEPPTELDKRMRFFIRSIRAFLDTGGGRPALSDPKFLDVLAFGERELLRDLSAVVQEYQREAYGRLASLRRLETATTIASLLLLVAVGLFLFRPMVRRICEDRNHLEQANEALERLAVTDQLTGAFNRLRLNAVMTQEIERGLRYGQALSVIMYDIDHFKQVNDTKGHGAGDDLLRGLTRLVLANIRATDALFRYGGEEFIVTLPHTNLAQAGRAAEKLRALVAGQAFPHGLSVTISLGVAEFRSGESADALMARVDAALYRAKAAGRDRVEPEEPAGKTSAQPSLNGA